MLETKKLKNKRGNARTAVQKLKVNGEWQNIHEDMILLITHPDAHRIHSS